MTIAASAGLGGASARAGRASCNPPPQGGLREGCVLTVGPAQRGQDKSWWAAVGARDLPQTLCPATAQVQDSEDSLGLVYRPAGPLFWSRVAPSGRKGNLGRRPRC